MKAAKIYVDTSAYLCLVLNEAGASRIEKTLDKAGLYASSVLFLEAARNFLRLARQRLIDATEYSALVTRLTEDAQAFTIRDFTLDLALDPSYPAVAMPKSLDLAHLKTALWFQKSNPNLVFLSLDEKQKLAAKELGLTISPH